MVADWFRLPFEIASQPRDAGSRWALTQRSTTGFWDLTAPLVSVEVSRPPL